MSRHRDHLRSVASSMHFYGMREAPAISLRDRGLCGCGRLTGREQLVKAVEQLAQAEFDYEDLAARVSRPHARVRAGGVYGGATASSPPARTKNDVTLYLSSVLAERHGWSFIDQLLASSPQFVNGHLCVAQGLAAGTAALSFDHIISLGAADRRAGRLAVTIPADDPMPVWPQNAAILDGSPSPAAAKLFLRWLLGTRSAERHRPGRRLVAAPGHRAAAGPGAAGRAQRRKRIPRVHHPHRRRTGLPGPARGTHRAGHRPGIPLSPTSSPGPSVCR